MNKQLMTDFAEYLLESASIKFSSAGVLAINGERLTVKEFTAWMLAYCKADDTKKFLPILTEAESPIYALESLKFELKKQKNSVRTSLLSGTSDVVQSFSFDGLIPFISVTNSNKILFFSKKSQKITEYDYDTYMKVVDKEKQIKPIACVVSFNPYRPEQIYLDESEGGNCTHLNTYQKPDWQIGRTLTKEETLENSKLPTIIDEFFSHLFPKDECKEFVYDWLHYALSSRCETYLVMNGAKGIGKNVLAETICSALIGKNNHKIANVGALDGNFNSILAECRMILFDEFKMADDDTINRLKRYANSEQTIEYKGIDVGKTETTYNSFMICNNSLTDMRIAWDDRRFSVMDLTDKKLDDVWSPEKITTLLNIFKTPNHEYVRQFGYWLLYRKPVRMASEFTCYKGDHFYKLCYTSMPEWSKMIIDEINTGNKGYFDEAELKAMFRERTNGVHRFPHMSKVEDFLKNYKHNGTHYLGHIEKDERTYYLQVNEHFIKSSKDNTGIDWQKIDLL